MGIQTFYISTLRIIQFCIYKIRYYTKLGLILKPSGYYIIKNLVYCRYGR